MCIRDRRKASALNIIAWPLKCFARTDRLYLAMQAMPHARLHQLAMYGPAASLATINTWGTFVKQTMTLKKSGNPKKQKKLEHSLRTKTVPAHLQTPITPVSYTHLRAHET